MTLADRMDPQTGALAFYRDLHAHPELSGDEARTAVRLRSWLSGAGITVVTGVGGHGVVGTLTNGTGPTVALRAELDALPIHEQTGLPYASTVTSPQPAMHACGHDLHLAALAGAASELSRARDRWRGTVMFIGQPAEETLTGASAMLADGLYQRFGRPDVVLAQHTVPMPAGMIGHGPLLAGSVSLRITIHGRGGHAGMPHACVDPIVIAATTVVALQSVVSRQTAPAEAAVVNVGRIHAGSGANTIPDRATMDVTIRALSTATLARMLASVERIVRAQCAAGGSPADPEIETVSRSPVTSPDPHVTTVLRAAHERAFGAERLTFLPPSLATEDVAHLATDGIGLGYWMIGAVGPRQWARAPGSTAAEKLAALPGNHSGRFAPDAERALPDAITAMVVAARAHLDPT